MKKNQKICDFCSGKKKIIQNTGIAQIVENKFLVVESKERKYIYDLSFCPACGRQLSYNSIEKIYINNITEDKIIAAEYNIPALKKNPLHSIICDRGFPRSKMEKQVCCILSESQLKEAKEKGYTYFLCSTGCLPYADLE